MKIIKLIRILQKILCFHSIHIPGSFKFPACFSSLLNCHLLSDFWKFICFPQACSNAMYSIVSSITFIAESKYPFPLFSLHCIIQLRHCFYIWVWILPWIRWVMLISVYIWYWDPCLYDGMELAASVHHET